MAPNKRGHFLRRRMNDEKNELLFQDLFVEKEFRPLIFPVGEEFVQKFLETVQDKNPLYSQKNIAPQSIAGIYSRLSYLQDHRMPFGGILLAQDYEFYRFIRVGDTLISRAKVTRRYQEDKRNFVTIEVNTHNQRGEKISLVRLFIRWPK